MNYSKKHLKHIAYKCYNSDEYGEDFDTWYKRIADSTKEIAQYDNCFRNQKKIWRLPQRERDPYHDGSHRRVRMGGRLQGDRRRRNGEGSRIHEEMQ